MTIGFYSPLPPANTGVADYSARLLTALRAHFPIRVSRDGDINVYHIGNNRAHISTYRRALEQPGIVVLHDAVLHHFLLGTLDAQEYIDEFVFNYGESQKWAGEEFWREQTRAAQDERFFRYPMLRRVVESARAVVVHNESARTRVLEAVPSARVFLIPHLAASEWMSRTAEPLRLAWGVRYVFGVFGYLRGPKRIASVLAAFRQVEPAGAALLVAGSFASDDEARAFDLRACSAAIRRVGHTSEDQLQSQLQGVDAVLNLRYPSAGETSGIAIRAMACGKPVFVTEASDFPVGTCIPIEHGLRERPMLATTMRWLIAHPDAGRTIGRRAAAHIAEHHSVAIVAERYAGLIRSLLDA